MAQRWLVRPFASVNPSRAIFGGASPQQMEDPHVHGALGLHTTTITITTNSTMDSNGTITSGPEVESLPRPLLRDRRSEAATFMQSGFFVVDSPENCGFFVPPLPPPTDAGAIATGGTAMGNGTAIAATATTTATTATTTAGANAINAVPWSLRASSSSSGCSLKTMVLLSLPRLAISMAWTAQWIALGPYLSIFMPKYAVQLTQMIGPLTGMLVAPTVGVLSDRCVCRFGKRKPFLLFGAITSATCWVVMAFCREIGQALGDVGADHRWTCALIICLYAWMDITVNIVQTPAFLIMADFAGDRQTIGGAVGQATSTLGNLLVAGYIFVRGPAHNSMTIFLGMLSSFMLVTVGTVCLFVKEQTPPRPQHTNQRGEPLGKFRTIWNAFCMIGNGIKTFPPQLAVYAVMFMLVMYGYTAFNGNIGQFFGISVYGGDPANAGVCKHDDSCSDANNHFDQGVRVAGGLATLLFHITGYIYSWLLPVLVQRMGAKPTLCVSIVPQCLLIVMALSTNVAADVAIAVLTCITQVTFFAMVVPVVVHQVGVGQQTGVYVGALNASNCLGQLLNFLVGALVTNTHFGYRLPVFLGGVASCLSLLVALVLFQSDLNSMQ